MFKVKAAYSEQFQVKTAAANVRQFFANTRNFVEMMPNVEGIRADGDNVIHWTIRADIPFLGAMSESFAVVQSENNENLIEYTPAPSETKNFLRYAADFVETEAGKTKVQISQTVELRRETSGDLHFLAGFAGEATISQQMQKNVEAMIKSFLEKAKTKLEAK